MTTQNVLTAGAVSSYNQKGSLAPAKRPAFPFSSPSSDDRFSTYSVDSRAGYRSRDRSTSPTSSQSTFADDGSSQDAFHLERYSRDTTITGNSFPSKRAPSPYKQTKQKRQRPNLNVLTNFSNHVRQPLKTSVLVEEVAVGRAHLGQNKANSIKSAVAERMYQTPTTMKDSPRTKAKFKQLIKMAQEKRRQTDQLEKEAYGLNTATSKTQDSRNDYVSPNPRSIVIGIQMSEDEAALHRRKPGDESAISGGTPQTPTIVLTPADNPVQNQNALLHLPETRDFRPSSSIYSSTTRRNSPEINRSTPPVPQIPSSLRNALVNPKQPGSLDVQKRVEHNATDYYTDVGASDDEWNSPEIEPRSHSSESTQQIFPSPANSDRPKSEGWWNLMLSPMLSRKGTSKSRKPERDVSATPPLPSSNGIVNISPMSYDEASPMTPHRAGIATARGSTWSQWGAWEKSRDINLKENPVPALPEVIAQETIPFHLKEPSEGLAAEYYHACAIEQLSGVVYFECENHCCAEKLPALQSVFDTKDTATSDVSSMGVAQTADDEIVSMLKRNRSISSPTSVMSPEMISPNVRQANTVEMVKAKSISLADKSVASNSDAVSDKEEVVPVPKPVSSTPPPRPTYHARSSSRLPNIATVVPPPPSESNQVLSPGPISPEGQQDLAPQNAVPMTSLAAPPTIINHYNTYHIPSQAPESVPTMERSVTPDVSVPAPSNNAAPVSGPEPPRSVSPAPAVVSATSSDSNQLAHQSTFSDTSSSESPSEKVGEKKKERGCLGNRGLLSKNKPPSTSEKKKKRRRCCIIFFLLLSMIIGCLLLAILLTRGGPVTPVESQWLNLTGFPPIPTGISTVARPDLTKSQTGCVLIPNLWSCAVPNEQHSQITPNNPDQPNFRFEISFQNGTLPANLTQIKIDHLSQGQRRSLIKRQANDPFSTSQFTPSPSPPDKSDQLFLGNTTDAIQQPFDGETTPFFITFLSVFPVLPDGLESAVQSSLSAKAVKVRQASNPSNFSFRIPPPAESPDGSAAPANLLPEQPFPVAQPLRLYNRNTPDEHFGFYMYYDRAIFLRNTTILNASSLNDPTETEDVDADGGSPGKQARVRCTFSQTRFHVQMWTRAGERNSRLLPNLTDSSTNSTNIGSAAQIANNLFLSSATNFNRPGSFPYPTTITIDRHGGNRDRKGIYCYAVDELQRIIRDKKIPVAERRDFGGVLVNPDVQFLPGDNDDRAAAAGGIDGGSGGCGCVWQNWS